MCTELAGDFTWKILLIEKSSWESFKPIQLGESDPRQNKEYRVPLKITNFIFRDIKIAKRFSLEAFEQKYIK